MASNVLIGEWATGLWTDLGGPPSLSAITISGYAVQPSTLGKLNNLIQTCYSGTGFAGTGITFDAVPDLTNTELALIEGMFRVNWYSQMATIMMGTSPSTIPWESIREADSAIKRPAATNLGKEYREMARQTQEQLNYLVNAYIEGVQGSSSPRSVDFLNPSYPGGSHWRG